MRQSLTIAARLTAFTALLGGMALVNGTARADTFEDKFTGTTLRSEWNPSIPVAGPTISVNNGLQIMVPDATFDQWSTVANAPELKLPAPAGDFTVDAQLNSVVGPDGSPVEGANYHAVLTVDFGPMDQFFWGAYRSETSLTLERSGINGIGNIAIDTLPVWLRIKKTGNDYTFYYKQDTDTDWQQLLDASGAPIVQTVSKPVITVGLQQKTWANVPSTATWGDFIITGDQLKFFGKVGGKITTNGPSPAKVGVRATDATGNVLSSTIAAADGTYSLTVPSGTVNVNVFGSALTGTVADQQKNNLAVVANQTTNADFNVQLLPDLNAATDQVFEDTFTGTSLKPDWQTVLGAAGPTVTVNNGLKIHVPDTAAYDYWVGVSDGPHIQVPAPKGDFIASAEITSANDATGTASDGENFQTGLIVSTSAGFGSNDFIYYGLDTSNGTLGVQRAGNGATDIPLAKTPVWLQIKKDGFNYTFFYKTDAAADWQPFLDPTSSNPVVMTIQGPPTNVGLIQKTWSALDITGNFADFRLEANSLNAYGTLSGKVTATGHGPQSTHIQVSDASGYPYTSIPVNADGTFSGSVAAGSYSLKVVGDTSLASQAGAAQSGVAIEAGKTTTANFTVSLTPDPSATANVLFEDKFPGTALNSQWKVTIPQDGPQILVNNGLTFDMPDGAFDNWSTVANAPKITVPAPQGDFIASVQISTVDDGSGTPLENLNYHTILGVYYGDEDALFWGVYRSNKTLRMEQTGTGVMSVGIPGLPTWVQIRKSGKNYTFYYKTAAAGEWLPLLDTGGSPIVVNHDGTPIAVGLEQKTWASIGTFQSKFDDFLLQSATSTGVLKGDLNGDGKVNIADATMALQFAVGNGTPTADQITAGDVVGGDGKIGIPDVTKILQAAIGAIQL